LSLVDITDVIILAGALDIQLFEHAIFNDRDPALLWLGDIDQHFALHFVAIFLVPKGDAAAGKQAGQYRPPACETLPATAREEGRGAADSGRPGRNASGGRRVAGSGGTRRRGLARERLAGRGRNKKIRANFDVIGRWLDAPSHKSRTAAQRHCRLTN